MKVFILGGPGSGKTSLARRLAATLAVPCFELDRVGYEGGAGPARPPAVRLADVAAIARQPGWVAEGVFIGWTAALAAAADVIVWLDVPWSVARRRIIVRHVRTSWRGTNQHPGLRPLWRFLGDCRRYYHATDPAVGRAEAAAWLAAYDVKVMRVAGDQNLDRLVQTLLTQLPKAGCRTGALEPARPEER